MRLTSTNRSSTCSATWSGTPRLRIAVASSARVRGAPVSSRRQIARATDSGSGSASSVAPVSAGGSVALRRVIVGRSEVDRNDLGVVRQAEVDRDVGELTDPELVLDLPLDLVGELGVVAEERPGVLLALAELVGLVGVPSARLLHDAVVDTH